MILEDWSHKDAWISYCYHFLFQSRRCTKSKVSFLFRVSEAPIHMDLTPTKDCVVQRALGTWGRISKEGIMIMSTISQFSFWWLHSERLASHDQRMAIAPRNLTDRLSLSSPTGKIKILLIRDSLLSLPLIGPGKHSYPGCYVYAMY